MDKHLMDIIIKTGDEFQDQISVDSRFYIEVDIGKQAKKYGYQKSAEQLQGVYAIIPLKRPMDGMKVRVDGRTFVNYAQFESGVVVPKYVARQVPLFHKTFVPNHSMIMNYN